MTTFVLYASLCTAAHYLLARAMITQFLWNRYPERVDRFFLCAACSGFWYGLIAGAIGGRLKLSFLGLDGQAWYTPPVVALCAMVWTPILADLQITALLRLGVPDPRLPQDAKYSESKENNAHAQA
jgi:hypothetical protein